MTSFQPRQRQGIPTGGQFAGTTHAEPAISLTSAGERKRDFRGTHFEVTLPDGTVATRASKAVRPYTHVIANTAEKPELVIRAKRIAVQEAEERIAVLDRAIENPEVKTSLNYYAYAYQAKESDRGSGGIYEYATVEAVIPNPNGDARRPLARAACNGEGITRGYTDFATNTYHQTAKIHVKDWLIAQLQHERASQQRRIANEQRNIAAVEAGTYRLAPAKVARWSTSEGAATRALKTREFNDPKATSEVLILPVDSP